jgi:hypothetical protein
MKKAKKVRPATGTTRHKKRRIKGKGRPFTAYKSQVS